jgi:hypothetical protein
MAGILFDKYRYAPPRASQFATLVATNSQSPTRTDTNGRGLSIDFGASPAGGDNVRAVLKAKTTLTTTYSIITRMVTTSMVYSFQGSGLCLYDGTKLVTFAHACSTGNSSPGIKIDKWTNATTFSAEPFGPPDNKCSKWFEWLRIDVVAGDPSKFYISDNGTDWIQIFAASMAAFLTYTHVGFCTFVNRNGGPFAQSGTNQQNANVLYYSDPDIVPGF